LLACHNQMLINLMIKLENIIKMVTLYLASVALSVHTSRGNPEMPVIVKDTSSVTIPKVKSYPNPKTAARLAIIPGARQLYNRDFWKLPIVYLSLGGGIFAYRLNSLKYQDFLRAYKSFYDLNTGQLAPGVSEDSQVSVKIRNVLNTKSRLDSGTRDQIEKQKNYWRRYRNIAIVAAGLIYTLSIIEANVASHLKGFDISEDLTLHVLPKLSQPALVKICPWLRMELKIN
jgi:hypothetical protein